MLIHKDSFIWLIKFHKEITPTFMLKENLVSLLKFLLYIIYKEVINLSHPVCVVDTFYSIEVIWLWWCQSSCVSCKLIVPSLSNCVGLNDVFFFLNYILSSIARESIRHFYILLSNQNKQSSHFRRFVPSDALAYKTHPQLQACDWWFLCKPSYKTWPYLRPTNR